MITIFLQKAISNYELRKFGQIVGSSSVLILNITEPYRFNLCLSIYIFSNLVI